ncbi:MAG TPA: PIN domain-containing protein [Candidatus Kapabacteria bacterium]|nr:PIN domain-containing protein [Candidatus Kapabacteria bacterium]
MERKRKILLDTNAIIYFLEGAAEFEVIGDFKTFYYSFITEIELLSYRDEERKQKILSFLKNGKLITINHKLISQTIEIRNKYRLKIPDAIIVASAQSIKADLYTSDEEIVKKIDFVKIHNLLKR